MPDKKTPQEASKLFHNIIKASVSPKATGAAPKKKERYFSKNEADEIRTILSTLHTLSRDDQKKVRADLWGRLKFFISDYTNSKAGFNAQDFDDFVKAGAIKIK